jgi:hypothetical protein
MPADFKLRPTRIKDFKTKQMIGVLCAIICMVIVGYGNRARLFNSAMNSNSCQRYNVDNVELRTSIDIPAIERENCSCILDEAANTKTNYFKIRTDAVDMDRYVERNSFISINETNLDLTIFGKLAIIPKITPDNSQSFYYHSGKGKNTDWLGIVDKNSGDLWVYMKYND